MKGIYLLLGSNLGDSYGMLSKARDLIATSVGQITNASSIYVTKAWGITDQPNFLNQVLKIESDLEPHALLEKINEIENKLGRKRYVKWGSRIIDIDILYYGKMVLRSEKLTIPHPENQNRKFVLVPMTEIAQDFVHPVLNLSQGALLEKCEDTLAVKKMHKKSQLNK